MALGFFLKKKGKISQLIRKICKGAEKPDYICILYHV